MSMIVESSTDSTLTTSHPNSFITKDSTQLSEIHKKNVKYFFEFYSRIGIKDVLCPFIKIYL